MQSISHEEIANMNARARSERSEYVHCQIKRLVIWLKAQVRGATTGLDPAPCCDYAAS